MSSLDIGSLFKNIPLEENIDISVDNLYNDNENPPNIPKYESFESTLLRDCVNDFKPVFYRRYVDAIFALLYFPDHADKFEEYLSSKHPDITFSIDKEKDGCLPFLDINILDINIYTMTIYKTEYYKIS